MRSSLPVIIFFFIHLTHAIWTIFSRNKPTYNHNLGDRDIQTRLGHRDCAPEFIRTRKEWWAFHLQNSDCEVKTEHGPRRFLFKPERSNYIEAVLCLQKKPALYKDVIGAKSRFDDFQVEHIKQTFNIHYSVWSPIWKKTPRNWRGLFLLLTLANYMHQGSFHRMAPMVCMDIWASTYKGVRLSRRTAVCTVLSLFSTPFWLAP